jgi:NADPH:quinone reductase-like Zn-dependent oxidoreductase
MDDARAMVVTRHGGPDVLELQPAGVRSPGRGEVAVAVRAIGLNLADVYARLGLYAAAPAPPFVPGFELAGTVAAVGDGVRGLSAGTAVAALVRFGAYATRVVVPATLARPLPAGWDWATGAAFPVAFLTAWYGLHRLGRLAAGETVVVHSAAGGVGTAACQLARRAGARVIGVVGSEDKREVATAAGADEVLVSPRYRHWNEVDALTGGRGVDLVLDAVAGPVLRRGLERLRPEGRYVVYGFAELMPRGPRRWWPSLAWRALRTPRVRLFPLVARNRTIAGFNLVHLWERQEVLGEALDAMLAAAARDELRPVVHHRFPLAAAGAAQERLRSRGTTGKVVLTVEPDEGRARNGTARTASEST